MIAATTDGLETVASRDETDVMTTGLLDVIYSMTAAGGIEEAVAEMHQQNASAVPRHPESPRSRHQISRMSSRSLTARDD